MNLGRVKPGIGAHIKADERQITIYNTVESWKTAPGLERAGMRRYLYETHRELGIPTGTVGGAYRAVTAALSELARRAPDLLAQYLEDPPDSMTRFKEQQAQTPAPPAQKGENPQMAGTAPQQPAVVAHIGPTDPKERGQQEVRIQIQQQRPADVAELEAHLTKALEVAERLSKRAESTVQVGLLNQALDRAEEVIQQAFQALNAEFNPLKARAVLETYLKAQEARIK